MVEATTLGVTNADSHPDVLPGMLFRTCIHETLQIFQISSFGHTFKYAKVNFIFCKHINHSKLILTLFFLKVNKAEFHHQDAHYLHKSKGFLFSD